MEIILHPAYGSEKPSLMDLYDRAISEAIELFIVTAYLTDWKPTSVIRDDCEELSFIVGTDFGITAKEACRSVLKWLPKTMKNDFLAADRIRGFHSKLVLWKNSAGECYLVLGSSNLTQAAFATNYEANVFSSISAGQYDVIKEWIYSVRLQCDPISEDWLKRYKEATKPEHQESGRKAPVVSFELPSGDDIDTAVKKRKGQRKAFTEIRSQLASLIKNCAAGQISNAKFYDGTMGTS
jgi:hypothetical protein